MSWLHGTRARLRLLLDRPGAEARMDEEIALHLELEAERLVREERLAPDEARRRARVAFGGVQQHREALRDGRGLAWLGGARLDLKLGARMLVKHPGLTVVGGLALAFAVAVGVVTFRMVGLFLHPTLPLPGGDRLVHVGQWDREANAPEPRLAYDFPRWREGLRTITELGAYRDDPRNLVGADGEARPVAMAEITTGAFRLAPARPLLGRTLGPADALPGAPPVLVLGHELWRQRFAGDSGVVGRSVPLGEGFATVVGVMPEGFAFPVAHDAWTPLRVDGLTAEPREGSALTVFGRLAPGRSRADAQRELDALARREAAASPATHAHLQPRVTPYATLGNASTLEQRGVLLSVQGFTLLLLALVCGNVALLLFARAASREGELVVRTALGASRGRIVAQLVAEALVLGSVATVVGVGAADLALRYWGRPFLAANIGQVPFWYELQVTPGAVLYAGALTVLAALMAGALPALRITRGLGAQLRQGSAGGGGARFGGVWTAVIVTQVAFTVMFPVAAWVVQREAVRIEAAELAFPAEQYLGVLLDLPAPAGGGAGADSTASAAWDARFTAALALLRERVEAQPDVRGVTFVDRLPRDYHRERMIAVEGDAPAASSGAGDGAAAAAPQHEVSLAAIDPSYFDVLGTPPLAGRAFRSADLAPGAHTVIVDQAFVDLVLEGRNPLGRRIRIPPTREPATGAAADSLPWHEIVGVVPELGMSHAARGRRDPGIYLPLVPGEAGPVFLVAHARGDPLALVPRLRAMAADVDPRLRFLRVHRVDEVLDGFLWVLKMWLRITVVLSAIALLLSLAGIYAVLSFTVARRTREIGVRVALGASRRRVLAAIFRRPLTQVACGVAAGGALVAVLALAITGGGVPAGRLALLAVYSLGMFGVCALACLVPTWRALRIQPTEALRVE